MTMRADVRLAAEIIEGVSEELRRSYTVNGEWPKHDRDAIQAESEYHRNMALVHRLRDLSS